MHAEISPLRRRSGRPMRVMGIVNATPDSFWAESRFDTVDRAIAAGLTMFRQGAWAVDVGGESTRPGAHPVSVEREIDRILPVITGLASHGLVSVDTRNREVAEEAVRAGASVINDVSGKLYDLAGWLSVGYVGMHSHTVPVAPDAVPHYDDVHSEVARFLRSLADAAEASGVEQVWIDPGIGFGKSSVDNLHLLRQLPALCATGVPVLLGVSRKSFIGTVTGRRVGDRLAGSLAVIAPAWSAGVDVIRVHDVVETLDTIAVLEAISASENPDWRMP